MGAVVVRVGWRAGHSPQVVPKVCCLKHVFTWHVNNDFKPFLFHEFQALKIVSLLGHIAVYLTLTFKLMLFKRRHYWRGWSRWSRQWAWSARSSWWTITATWATWARRPPWDGSGRRWANTARWVSVFEVILHLFLPILKNIALSYDRALKGWLVECVLRFSTGMLCFVCVSSLQVSFTAGNGSTGRKPGEKTVENNQ